MTAKSPAPIAVLAALAVGVAGAATTGATGLYRGAPSVRPAEPSSARRRSAIPAPAH